MIQTLNGLMKTLGNWTKGRTKFRDNALAKHKQHQHAATLRHAARKRAKLQKQMIRRRR